MRESEIAIRSGAVTLAGTLTRPATATDLAVLCIHGSGPLDRNENLKVQRLDIFNTIAADLATRGIATLRYDKRGCGRSTGEPEAEERGLAVGYSPADISEPMSRALRTRRKKTKIAAPM